MRSFTYEIHFHIIATKSISREFRNNIKSERYKIEPNIHILRMGRLLHN